MAENSENRNATEENAVKTYAENDINNCVLGEYNYEIELSDIQKAIVIILNILPGGIGTILVPFLNKKRKIKTMIFAGILIGLLEIFHFLHFFSVLMNVKYIERFYNYISDDNFLGLFFNTIKEENNYLDENENKNEIDSSSTLKTIINSLNLNLSETIAKKERIKCLKLLFSLISGMSYCASIFTASVNFINAKPDSPNYKLGIKILLYNFLNPGTGIILSCFSLFPSCDCSNNSYDIKGIVLSLLGIITGFIIMICPISLCIGLYLVKLTNKLITILPIKITFIFIGITGTFLSFLLSGINKKTILESVKIKVKPLELIIGCGDSFVSLPSKFGWASFFRLLANIIVPGLGTITLTKKYKCTCGLFLTSIFQLSGGLLFFLCISILNRNDVETKGEFDTVVLTLIESTESSRNDYTYYPVAFNYIYTVGLCFYFSGIFLILILDYLDETTNFSDYISSFAFIVLTILTGGLGFTLFLEAFIVEFRLYAWLDNLLGFFLFPIGGFICFGGFLYDLFFWDFASKACRIAFPICYFVCISFFQILRKYNSYFR